MKNYKILRNYLRSPDYKKREMALFALSFTNYRPYKYVPVDITLQSSLQGCMIRTAKLGDNINDEEGGSMSMRRLFKELTSVDGYRCENIDEKQKRLFESWMKEWGFDLDFNSRRLFIFMKTNNRQPDKNNPDENFLHRILLDRRNKGGEVYNKILGLGIELKFRRRINT